MKRLLCLYKPSNDKNYPWALKHPKVKSALALFKTRKDAMNWFLELGYDCATYFQTEKKVFGGLFISEKNEDGIFEFEVNTERYDGNVDEFDILREFNVDQKTGLRNYEEAGKYLREIVDFKVLRDHETYFPADDDFVIERKKNPKDVQIEKLQKQIEELQLLLQSKNVDSHEVSVLLAKLNDTNSDKAALQREIEILKARAESYDNVEVKKEVEVREVIKEVPVEVVKEVEVIKEVPVEVVKEVEVIKEVPVEVVKEVEVIKEVPVEVVKEIYTNDNDLIKYHYIRDLSKEEQLESLAVFANKLEKISDKVVEEKITSIQDRQDIKNELSYSLSVAKELKEYYNEDVKKTKLLKLIIESLTKSTSRLSTKIFAREDVAHAPENFVYVQLENGENIRLSQEISFVIYNRKYVAFVEEKDYSYAFVAQRVSNKDHLLVFTDYSNSVKQETIVKTKEIYVNESDSFLFWSVLLISLAFGVLITLVFMLWLGYVPTLA
ncbi:MAG3090 family protein [Mycoplasma sp. CSL10166]|uniref:MAG3090 family protein n=1 Tax=Mycoplasma sp. CSL10166 TaxID=2813825 RepID=UPI00197BAE11|nr:hypothetical protein [Mycoplasma sp. CSL10166]MBN4084561.1 hypothetical protein [Mycoplasma sp. CSL10166]